jgi:hypothetical protein
MDLYNSKRVELCDEEILVIMWKDETQRNEHIQKLSRKTSRDIWKLRRKENYDFLVPVNGLKEIDEWMNGLNSVIGYLIENKIMYDRIFTRFKDKTGKIFIKDNYIIAIYREINGPRKPIIKTYRIL